MAFSIGFGAGGSPSSGRSITGATSIYTYGMFTYPTGNLDLNGARPVANQGVSLNGSFGGGYTGAGADTSGNVFITSTGAFTTLTGYPGNGFNMVASTGFTWGGGFQGTFFWSTVPTIATIGTPTKVGRNVTITCSASASNGGETISSYRVRYRTSTDGVNWGAYTTSVAMTNRSYTYTNLTPALFYQFQTFAQNSVGNSQGSTSAAVFVSAGGKRWDGSAWQPSTTSKRWDGSAWVDLTVAKRWSGSAWVDLS